MLVYPNFAAIASSEYCTEWSLSETEPLEDILQRFQSGGLTTPMMTPSKGVPPSSSQTREPPKTRSHSQIIEGSISEPEEEVHSAEDYIMPRVEGAPKVKIPKSAKFTVPIPPIDSRVKEEWISIRICPQCQIYRL